MRAAGNLSVPRALQPGIVNRFVSGVGLSGLVHTGVFVYLGWPSAPLPVTLVQTAIAPEAPEVALAVVAPTEMVIELVTLAEPVEPPRSELRAAVSPALRATAARAASRPLDPGDAPALATTTATTTAGTSELPTAPAEPASGGLRMRGHERPRLVMPDLSRIAEAAPPPLAPVAPSGELAEVGGGRRRSDQGTFVAEIGRDGSVTLKDRPNLRVGFAVPSPRALGQGLANWYRDPYAQTRDPERQPLPSGVVDDEEEQRKRPKTVPLISGSFDVTDWLMRMAGRDPYMAAKLRFLDRTRAERVELAAEYRQELLRNVTVIVRAHAARAWEAPGTAAEKRRLLFELWDECIEGGSEDERQAAELARAAILGFVQSHLPAGSEHGYSAEELTELNRKRSSKQPFSPYGR